MMIRLDDLDGVRQCSSQSRHQTGVEGPSGSCRYPIEREGARRLKGRTNCTVASIDTCGKQGRAQKKASSRKRTSHPLRLRASSHGKMPSQVASLLEARRVPLASDTFLDTCLPINGLCRLQHTRSPSKILTQPGDVGEGLQGWRGRKTGCVHVCLQCERVLPFLQTMP